MALVTDSLTIPPASTLNGTGKGAAARQLPAAASRAVVPLVYGEDRISGLILNVLTAAGTPGTLLVQVLWCFACDSINDPRLNDQALPSGASIAHYTGAQTTADATLVAAFAAQGITGVLPLTGYAWSLLVMPAALFDGQLNVTARIRGRRCYDPTFDSTASGVGPQRLADPTTWAYTDIPAVCLGDYLSSTVYGCGRTVNWDSVRITGAANRVIVPGSSEQRRLVGVSFTSATPASDVAETLRAYAGCFLLPSTSGVRLLPDQDDASVATYRHAYGEIAAIDSLDLRDLNQAPTAVEVIYTDTSAIPWRDASAIAQIDGAGTTKPWRLSQVRLPGVHRYGQALREATERLNKLVLNDITTGLEVFDVGIKHDKGDIITVDHPLGLAMTPMRVTSVTMPSAGRWRLGLVRHSSAAYSDIIASVAAIQDALRIVPAPVGLGIKLNVNDFAGTVNYSEAYIHAVDAAGNAIDAPGFILVNGVATSVPNGPLNTNLGPAAGYIVWDSAGSTFSALGGSTRPYVLARRYQGAWQYDDNNAAGWTTFTPTATHWIIGTLETGGVDTGNPGSAPGISRASLWAAASTLNALEASADAAYAAATAAQGTADTAAGNASSALTQLSNIASDSILSPSEKPSVVQDYTVITGEQSGIDARATAFGISTEKTTYDAAVTALTTYLGTLTGWNTVPGSDVAIVGTTFRSKFADVYTTRQALLNKIAAEAGLRATWTQVGGRPVDDAILNNLIDLSQWRKGATAPGFWSLNGEYNRLVNVSPAGGDLTIPGPKGSSDCVWYCREDTGDGNAGGGWNGQYLDFDPALTYRFVVPIRRLSGTASAYWGTDGTVCDLNTTSSASNPYFAYSSSLTLGRWYLFVGYMFPGNTTGHTNDSAGIWDCTTGAKVANGNNFNFVPGSGSANHRAYQFYASAGAEQVFGRPMVNLVDGTEPSLREYFEAGAVLNSFLVPSITAAQLDASNALIAASDAQATADGKVVTFVQAGAPTAEGVGDLWIDNDDANKLYRWDGSSWVAIRDTGIAAALANASNAQATADGKIVSFYQTGAPTATAVGDLWIDTDDDNKQYRWSGSSWVSIRDAGIAAAIGAAATAQATADGKIDSFYQTSAPGSFSNGDIWFDTDDGNKQYVAVGGSWVLAADTRIGTAITAAAGAQATADGKVTTFYASSAPTAIAVGDLWSNTTAGSTRLSRWSGSAWVVLSVIGTADVDTAQLADQAATVVAAFSDTGVTYSNIG